MNTATVKMSLHLSPEANNLLEDMSEEGHMSKSDVLRKAIALMKVALDSKKDGNKIAVVDKDKKVLTEIVGV